jgi:hypothetical protein
MVGVLKLPSSAVALCGAWPVLRQVTVSPTATVTEAGEKKRVSPWSPTRMRTCAPSGTQPTGRRWGRPQATPTEPPDESPPADSAFGDWSAADDPFGGASAGAGDTVVFVGSVAVPVVVVVASVVVPASCASESAGIAQLNARTSIPLARA